MTSAPLVVPPPVPAESTATIDAGLASALVATLAHREQQMAMRLEAVARNYPPALRARGFDALAAGLESSVADVIGHADDPERPGSLHRLSVELRALIEAAEQV